MRESNKKYLDRIEAAEYLGFSKSGFAKMASRGEGPDHSKLGNRTRYAVDDLDRWFEAHKVDLESRRGSRPKKRGRPRKGAPRTRPKPSKPVNRPPGAGPKPRGP